jgi:hypothetical protein
LADAEGAHVLGAGRGRPPDRGGVGEFAGRKFLGREA